jgi:colanic acid biosynthesis glycosyl transferase WcaI
LHILIVSQYFWPEEFRINDLAAELVARGHKVTVLTGKPNYPKGRIFPDYASNPAAFDSYKGVEIVRVPLIPRRTGPLWLMLNYLSFVITGCTIGVWKLRKVDFDVIFSPQLSPITAMLPSVLLRNLRNRKFVMWVLDLWPDTLRALGVVKSPRILGWVGLLVRFIYHRTDKIFVQSQGLIPNVLKYTAKPVDVEFLPNWSEEMPNLTTVKATRHVPTKANSFNIMFAGAIGESQDFPTVLNAAEQLRNDTRLRWLIVGDGRVSDWVEKEVARRKIPNFVMLGRHPVDAMPSFYKHADAMLVILRDDPIFEMTIPGKVQSYLAAGKPVIAVLNGEGANVIAASGAGISIAPGDADGLVAAIRSFMAMERPSLELLGERGKTYSNREFGRAMLIDRIENTLKTLAVRPIATKTIPKTTLKDN